MFSTVFIISNLVFTMRQRINLERIASKMKIIKFSSAVADFKQQHKDFVGFLHPVVSRIQTASSPYIAICAGANTIPVLKMV